MNQPHPSPTLDDVRLALALSDFDVIAAWRRMAPMPRPLGRPADMPGVARTAGVLMLLYPHRDALYFLLTRRTETVANHKGQVSFPGGAVEPGETPARSALRETCEEVRICLDESSLVGALTPIYVIVSDFTIHPFVGSTLHRPDFLPDPVEVAEVLEVPLSLIMDESIKARELWNLRGMEVDVPFYRIQGHTVWGATAVILSELEGRLRAVL